MDFRRYRTPSGAHVSLSKAWGRQPGFTELRENPLGVDGRPKPPIQPARKTSGTKPVQADPAIEPEAIKEATK